MEKNMNKRVFGVYKNEADAQKAVDELLDLGYPTEEISVLSRSSDPFEGEAAVTSTETGLKDGAAAGVALGGLGGLLAGLGLLVIPGIGPILAAGPIATFFAGAIAGGAIGGTIGTIGGAMMDAGVKEADARYIEDRFGAGDIIVYVDADVDRFDKVSDTLGYQNAGAKEAQERYLEDRLGKDKIIVAADADSEPLDKDTDALGYRNAGAKEAEERYIKDRLSTGDVIESTNAKVGRQDIVSDAADTSLWNTESEYDTFESAVKKDPYYPDTDIHHDNMDLDVCDEPVEVVLESYEVVIDDQAGNAPDQAEFDKFNGNDKKETYYSDMDIHHDNMDLEIGDEPAEVILESYNVVIDDRSSTIPDPMRITDPIDPNYRAGATITEKAPSYKHAVNTGDAMRTDPLDSNYKTKSTRKENPTGVAPSFESEADFQENPPGIYGHAYDPDEVAKSKPLDEKK